MHYTSVSELCLIECDEGNVIVFLSPQNSLFLFNFSTYAFSNLSLIKDYVLNQLRVQVMMTFYTMNFQFHWSSGRQIVYIVQSIY